MLIYLTSSFDIQDTSIDSLYEAVESAVQQITEKLVSEVIVEKGRELMESGTLKKEYGPVIWKDSKGKKRGKLMSPWGMIEIPHLIIQEKKTGKRHYISRRVLKLEERTIIPRRIKRILAMLGSVSPYRVAQGILKWLAGIKTSLMSIQRSVIHKAEVIRGTLSPDPQGKRVLEADGTGVKVRNTGKRGQEMKVLMQRGRDGVLRFIGTIIGQWHGGWEPLFDRFKKTLGKWRKPVSIVTDGDHTISKALSATLPEKTKLHRQRCTWHILREAGYMLWKDGFAKSSQKKEKRKIRNQVLYRIRKAVKIARKIPGKKTESAKYQAGRKAMGYMKSARHLCWDNHLWGTHSLLDRFIEERSFDGAIHGEVKMTTSSRLERLMHTLKRRTAVGGSWSARGAEAVATVRLAMYYNGWGLEKIK